MKKFKILYLVIFISIITLQNTKAQEVSYGKTAITTGIGFGSYSANIEEGFGPIMSAGWQKSFGQKKKLRINPYVVIGEFTSRGITDIEDQFFRMTALGANVHFDLIRYKAVSLVLSGGNSVNYSRGLENRPGDYFHYIYLVGSASFAIRINPQKQRVAYEIRPMNVQMGTSNFRENNFVAFFLTFGVEIKLNK